MNHKKFFIIIVCIAIGGNILARIPFWINKINHDGKYMEKIGTYEGYIYYNSPLTDSGIYRKEINGSEFNKISDTYLSSVYGEHFFKDNNIYFTARELIIYKIDLETLEEFELTDNKIDVNLLGYYNNMLFFTNYSDDGYLYSISTDSKNLKKIADADANHVNIEDGKVYFQSYNSGQKYVYDIENETVREINE